MWLAHLHDPPGHRPARTFIVLFTLLLALAGHHVPVAGEATSGSIPGPRTTEGSAPRLPCGDCVSPTAHEGSHVVAATGTEACAPLTPWKSSGGDGGVRMDRAEPVIVAPMLATTTGPMPAGPAHVDPPEVRRAFLQVYLN